MMGSLAAPPVSEPDLSNHREKESLCSANSCLLAGGETAGVEETAGDRRISGG